MCLGIYALVLFFTIDLCRVEAQPSVVLHRAKRRWISGTFQLTEEDSGPFPKNAVKVANDRSANHTILFSIKGEGVDTEPEKGLFSIDRETGQIRTHRKVDREKTEQFLFQVDALDVETLEVLDDHMLYKVIVNDINDNAPEFEQEIYKVDVRENTYPGKEICRVEAKDPDDARRGNGKVSYTIVSQNPSIPSNIFKINSENGSILLQKCLNYDAIKSYSLVIKARDNGLNVLSSSAKVQINVLDSNTNLPILSQQTASAIIDEDANNIVVLRISVTDKDNPHTPAWKARYKIVEGNEDDNYRIETDPETNDGILFLIKSLDYEQGPRRNIRITVENEEPLFTCQEINGNTSIKLSELTTVVTVKDKNDAPVFFPSMLTVQEVEGQKPGKILGKFNATDTDKFYKHSIRYVKASDPAEWIAVDSGTGVVSTVKTLDRESPYVNNSVYTFTVYAIEEGEASTTGTGTMYLSLIDINDNLPYLLESSQEMCDDGEVQFITITAQDNDLDPFSGPFTFELLDNEQHIKDLWKLSKATGNTVRLVRKKRIPIGDYTVPVKIRDRQGITQESSLNLRICHCLDGKTCPVPKPATTILSGAAIGLLFTGLLLFLLGFCLFMFCTFTRKKAQYSLPCNEPMWTLVNYNEEGGNADSQVTPFDRSSQLVSNDTGLGAGRDLSNNSDAQTYAQALHRDKGSLQHGGSILRPINTLQGLDAQAWANKHCSELDTNDMEVNYVPHVYSYEGDEQCEPCLDAISIVEGSFASDYLNDLGPRFATLARISQKENPL
ncbi:cadherin-like protein 26 isoform X2 [Mustelus asterias]